MTEATVTLTSTEKRRKKPRPPMNRLDRHDARLGRLFILPAVLGFLVFVAGPLISVFMTSLQDSNALSGRSEFVGLGNYADLASSGVFATVLTNSIIFSIAVVPANIVLGLTMALLVNQRLPGMAIFRSMYFVPAVVSMVAWTLVWGYMLQDRGGINAWLEAVGITGPNWLADPRWALTSVIIVQILKEVGISMILFLAALQEVPEEIKEAARIDGANTRQVFMRITLPLITPTMLIVSILAMINSLKAFSQVYLLTKGGPGISTAILGYYIYDQAFNAFQVGYASAAAVILFLIVLALTLLQWWSRRRWVFNES